ncbi:MAG: response regulator [Acidobacteriaceae bacterium]|nr:response regulator [Acidobacteriaceae bacterium]
MQASGHILIVEDESINATFIEYQLTKLGYSIAGLASSGEEAIELAKEARPDLVLMDIQLEGDLDGIETARAIRSSLGIPVVYLTGTSDPETLERARTTEAFGYLSKPFQENQVHSTVQMALSKAEIDRRVREERKWLTTALRWIADAVIATDPTGAVKLLNPAAERLTGWHQEEALGRDLDEVLHTLDPQTRKPAESVIVQLMRESNIPAIKGHKLLLPRNGTEMTIEETATCITSESGEVTGILVVLRSC